MLGLSVFHFIASIRIFGDAPTIRAYGRISTSLLSPEGLSFVALNKLALPTRNLSALFNRIESRHITYHFRDEIIDEHLWVLPAKLLVDGDYTGLW